MDYGQIISQSWNLLWKHKILWIFGFLAALGSGGGGGNIDINRTFGGPTNLPEQNVLSPEVTRQIEQIVKLVERGEFSEAVNTISAIIGFPAIFLVGLVGFLIAFFIVMWLISIIARASLVAAVKADYKDEPISWNPLFSIGTSKLWQLVGLKFTLFGIPGLLFFLVVLTSFATIFLSFMRGTAAGQMEPPTAIFAAFPLLMCGLVCVLIPLSIALYIVEGYAFRSIVMDDMGVFQGIKHGWRVGMDHLGPTIILSIIFTVIGLVVAAAILIPIGLFAFIYDGAGFAAMAFTTVASLIIGAAINTVFVTMQSIAYSKAYLEFTAKKPAPVPVDVALSSPDEAFHNGEI